MSQCFESKSLLCLHYKALAATLITFALILMYPFIFDTTILKGFVLFQSTKQNELIFDASNIHFYLWDSRYDYPNYIDPRIYTTVDYNQKEWTWYYRQLFNHSQRVTSICESNIIIPTLSYKQNHDMFDITQLHSRSDTNWIYFAKWNITIKLNPMNNQVSKEYIENTDYTYKNKTKQNNRNKKTKNNNKHNRIKPMKNKYQHYNDIYEKIEQHLYHDPNSCLYGKQNSIILYLFTVESDSLNQPIYKSNNNKKHAHKRPKWVGYINYNHISSLSGNVYKSNIDIAFPTPTTINFSTLVIYPLLCKLYNCNVYKISKIRQRKNTSTEDGNAMNIIPNDIDNYNSNSTTNSTLHDRNINISVNINITSHPVQFDNYSALDSNFDLNLNQFDRKQLLTLCDNLWDKYTIVFQGTQRKSYRSKWLAHKDNLRIRPPYTRKYISQIFSTQYNIIDHDSGNLELKQYTKMINNKNNSILDFNSINMNNASGNKHINNNELKKAINLVKNGIVVNLYPPRHESKAKQKRNIHYDYVDLMLHSRFCFILSGDAPWSFRLMDVLSAGCIPVIFADTWVLPFDSSIDWKQYVIRIDEIEITRNKKEWTTNPEIFVKNWLNGKQTNKILKGYYNDSFCNWHIQLLKLYNDKFVNPNKIVDAFFDEIAHKKNIAGG